MSALVRDLSNEKLALAYENWLSLETSNWTVGLLLLVEISRRHGTSFPHAQYLRGLRRIFEIKPTMRDREEQFFPANFAVPIAEIKTLFRDLGKDFCLATVEGVNIKPFTGSNRYAPPLIDSLERFNEQIELLLKDAIPRFKAASSGRLLTFGSCFAVNVADTCASVAARFTP